MRCGEGDLWNWPLVRLYVRRVGSNRRRTSNLSWGRGTYSAFSLYILAVIPQEVTVGGWGVIRIRVGAHCSVGGAWCLGLEVM